MASETMRQQGASVGLAWAWGDHLQADGLQEPGGAGQSRDGRPGEQSTQEPPDEVRNVHPRGRHQSARSVGPERRPKGATDRTRHPRGPRPPSPQSLRKQDQPQRRRWTHLPNAGRFCPGPRPPRLSSARPPAPQPSPQPAPPRPAEHRVGTVKPAHAPRPWPS